MHGLPDEDLRGPLRAGAGLAYHEGKRILRDAARLTPAGRFAARLRWAKLRGRFEGRLRRRAKARRDPGARRDPAGSAARP